MLPGATGAYKLAAFTTPPRLTDGRKTVCLRSNANTVPVFAVAWGGAVEHSATSLPPRRCGEKCAVAAADVEGC